MAAIVLCSSSLTMNGFLPAWLSCLKNPAIISNLLSQLISFFNVVTSHIGTNVGLAFLMPPALSLVGSISSASVQSRVSYWCGEMFKRDVELSNSPEFFRKNSTLYFNFFFFLWQFKQLSVSMLSLAIYLEGFTLYNETQELKKIFKFRRICKSIGINFLIYYCLQGNIQLSFFLN